MKSLHAAVVLACAALVGACSISTTVRPVADVKITDLCIQFNPAVSQEGFLPELRKQIEGYGVKTSVFNGDVPAECRYHMTYTANWRWDMALYLFYAEVKVFEGRNQLGEGVYDARMGGANMSKFGPTAEKLRTITAPLFGKPLPASAEEKK